MAHDSPLRKRPCRDGCGADVFVARRMPTGKWLAFEAAEIPESSDLRHVTGVYLLVGERAFTRRDFIENLHLHRELPEEAARRLADEYPHHKVHHHHREEEPDGQDAADE